MGDKVTLAIGTMVKDENDYLPEWIAYHRAVGVEHFFIYDNDSPVPVAKTLAPEIQAGIVTVNVFPGPTRQVNSLNDCVQRHRDRARWMAFIDVDEFIVPHSHDCLPSLLWEFEEHSGLAVNWQVFGAGEHLVRPEGLQIENFTRKAPVNYWSNRHVKTIARPGRIVTFHVPHFCFYSQGGAVNEERRPVLDSFSDVSVKKIQVNHYYFRSKEEYEAKLRRWDAGDGRGTRPAFDDTNAEHSVETDVSILRFAEKTKEFLAKR